MIFEKLDSIDILVNQTCLYDYIFGSVHSKHYKKWKKDITADSKVLNCKEKFTAIHDSSVFRVIYINQ